MAEVARPLPTPDQDSREYWEGCRRHELLVQRCRQCGTYRFPPSPMCGECNSTDIEWAKVSGKGQIYSWIVVHQPTIPAFADKVPFAVVLVEIDEEKRVRIPGNLLGGKPEDIKIGMRVQVTFEDVTDEVTLPQWRCVGPDDTASS